MTNDVSRSYENKGQRMKNTEIRWMMYDVEWCIVSIMVPNDVCGVEWGNIKNDVKKLNDRTSGMLWSKNDSW